MKLGKYTTEEQHCSSYHETMHFTPLQNFKNNLHPQHPQAVCSYQQQLELGRTAKKKKNDDEENQIACEDNL